MRSSIMQIDSDAVDIVTLMEFEAGELTKEEEILMCARLVLNEQLLDLPKMYTKLVNTYIREGVLDEEGNINFIKLKDYL